MYQISNGESCSRSDATAWAAPRLPIGLEIHEELEFGSGSPGLTFETLMVLIDFVLRFAADGGHCQRHRHLANTTILVLQGEQHLFDLQPDGSVEHRMRSAGAYHRGTGPEALPHMERGGDEGALVYYQCQADDGRLFEFLDDDLNVIEEVTIDTLLETWQEGRQAGLAA